MKVVLTQPNYIPWRGMFEQILESDYFIFYDNVQLPKGGGKGRGFITRVQIKTEQGQKWLSIPIARHAGDEIQIIKDAKFSDQHWRKSHSGSLQQAYQKADFYQEVHENLIVPIYDYQTDYLWEFNANAMQLIFGFLGINKPIYYSSELNVSRQGNASERVLEICQLFNASQYITAQGAAQYLDHELFEQANVEVVYMDYQLTPYPQQHGDFIPYVSILDLLFNVGKKFNF